MSLDDLAEYFEEMQKTMPTPNGKAMMKEFGSQLAALRQRVEKLEGKVKKFDALIVKGKSLLACEAGEKIKLLALGDSLKLMIEDESTPEGE